MIATFFALIGAFVYRMRGGMPPSFPRPIDQLIFAAPYAVFAYFNAILFPEWTAFIVLALTTLALVKGHGNTMDLGSAHDSEPEWYENNFALRWVKTKLPKYWYEAFAHGVSGLSYTIPCGLLCLSPVIAISGAFKAPAYMLAKRAEAGGTAGGELLTGAFLWGLLITKLIS